MCYFKWNNTVVKSINPEKLRNVCTINIDYERALGLFMSFTANKTYADRAEVLYISRVVLIEAVEILYNG